MEAWGPAEGEGGFLEGGGPAFANAEAAFHGDEGGDGFPQGGGMGCEAGMAGSASAICGEVDAEAEAWCVRGENGGAAVDEGIVFRAGARAARKDGDMPRGEAAYA